MDKKTWDMCKDQLLGNEYFRKRYENAPSDECRRYYQYKAYISETYLSEELEHDQELKELCEQIQSKLSLEDWKYILKHNGYNPHVLYIWKKIAELEGKA